MTPSRHSRGTIAFAALSALAFASLSLSACASHATGELLPAPVAITPRRAIAAETNVTDAASVRFGHAPPRVGQRLHVETEAHGLYDVDASSALYGGASYASVYDIDVLAVDGEGVTRARVQFLRNVRTTRDANGDHDIETPLHGHTFTLESNPWRAVDASGAPVPTDSEQLTFDIFSDLGMRGGIDAAIPDAPVALGQRVDALAPAVLHVLNARTWNLVHGTAELDRTDADFAVFRLDFAATTATGMDLTLAGEARVRRDDRLLASLDLEGTFIGPLPERTRGTLRIHRVARSTT